MSLITEHEFVPNPWPRHAHLCDARVNDGGRINQCGRPASEHATGADETRPPRSASAQHDEEARP